MEECVNKEIKMRPMLKRKFKNLEERNLVILKTDCNVTVGF